MKDGFSPHANRFAPTLRLSSMPPAEDASPLYRAGDTIMHPSEGVCNVEEIRTILASVSISICKACKEIPGFAANRMDRDALFHALIEKE